MLSRTAILTGLLSTLFYSDNAAAAAPPGQGLVRHSSRHAKRDVPDLTFNTISTSSSPSDIASQSYDYVIVGGGTAALAVAKRLSEGSNSTSILVIEAGDGGDAVANRILAPADAYYNGIANPTSAYDWGFYTSNQTDLGNRPVYWPRGKLLGGSSAVNGVYMTRASKGEHDAWASLNNGTAWDFENVLPYYKKHENYGTPSANYSAEAGGIEVDAANHGYDGPIHYSYAGYLFAQIGNWIPTFAALGVGTSDPASGVTAGAYISTSAIRPADQTRSYSRVGYFPNSVDNVDILTGYTVTKVNFETNGDGNITATGVSFQASSDAQSYNVTANQEVILSAGVIGSPHLLQLSGVGPADLLEANGIDVVHNLPGVGAQLSDHLSTSITFSSNAAVTGDLLQSNSTFNASQYELWVNGNGNQSLYSAPNEPIAYLNLSTVLGGSDAAQAFITTLKSQTAEYVANQSFAGTIAAGYEAISNAEIEDLLASGEAAVEVLMTNTGYDDGQAGKTQVIQFALQHPFSRGWVNLTSSDPFTMPSIDPGYLTHPSDLTILRAVMKYARTVGATAPLSDILGSEMSPGTDSVSTDAEIDAYLVSSTSTEYHPAGSCAMLPLSLGGVVDEELKVYGINALRVIDSSVIPIGLAAHLTSPTYAVAEKAAAIILGTDSTSSSSNSSSSESSSGSTNGLGSDAAASVTSAAPSASSITGAASAKFAAGSTASLVLMALVAILAF